MSKCRIGLSVEEYYECHSQGKGNILYFIKVFSISPIMSFSQHVNTVTQKSSQYYGFLQFIIMNFSIFLTLLCVVRLVFSTGGNNTGDDSGSVCTVSSKNFTHTYFFTIDAQIFTIS